MTMDKYDCVILCGGLGTRLREAIGDVPKVMAPVGGRPFLDIVIEYLVYQGVARVILCTGYKAEMIEHYYRENDFGITIEYSREKEPLGTGGALKNACGLIRSEPFLALNGDSLLPVNLAAFLDFHVKKNAVASILVSQVSQTSDFGSLQVDASGRITGFTEKQTDPNARLVNAGMYCFDRAIFERMPQSDQFMLEHDLFPKLVGQPFYGYCVDEEFIDIGTPERYRAVRASIQEGIARED